MSGDVIDAYTDGACLGNPGPGGWGVLLRFQGANKELSGSEQMTTNNRMELMAAISALEWLTRKSRIRVHTDSTYVKNGITQWIVRWKENGWRTAAKKPVANIDLWKRLEAAQDGHDVSWLWIRGHAGHPENERADALALAAAKAAQD